MGSDEISSKNLNLYICYLCKSKMCMVCMDGTTVPSCPVGVFIKKYIHTAWSGVESVCTLHQG